MSRRIVRLWFASICLATTICVIGPPALAAGAMIEEIVVTARKREESLQEVPVAVTSFTGEQMTNAGIDQFSDIAGYTPNLAMNQVSTYGNATVDVLTLRGQTSGGTQISNDPAVGVYQDGINNPHVTGMQASFFDIERVEVLKGPQGTLFGRNTTGGAINIISRKADYDGVHGYVEVDGGNDSTFNYRGAVNIPLIDDRMAVRLGYQHNDRDGFGESAITGQKLGGDRNEDYFRGSLRLDFDSVRVMVVGDWLKERENGPLVVTRGGFPNFLTNWDASIVPASGCGVDRLTALGWVGQLFQGIVTPEAAAGAACGLAFEQMRGAQGTDDIFTNYSDIENFDDTDAWTIGVTIEVDLTDSVMLKSITGRRYMKHNHLTNFSGSDFKAIVTGDPDFPDRADRDHQKYKLFTQEFNLSGVAMDGRLDWLGGAFYSNDQGEDRDWVNFNQNLSPFGFPHFFMYDAPKVDQQSWALFSQLTFALTDTVDLTLGGRYTEEKKQQVNAHGTIASLDPVIWACGNSPNLSGVIAPGGQREEICALPERSVTYSGWSYLFGLDWQATDNLMLYAKFSEGFRGGGFDIRSAYRIDDQGNLNPPDPFEPETATEFEIGVKADWFDNRVRTNLAAFTTKYKNKQESVIIPGPSTVTNNAGKADLDGFEAEIVAQPIEGLTLNATVAWLRGEYTDFLGAPVENACWNPTVGSNPMVDCPANGGSFDEAAYNAKGEKFQDPKWTYSIGGRYEVGIGAGTLGLQANYAWRDTINLSERRTDFQLPEDLRDEFYKSRGLLNGRIDYDMPDWGVNIALWATNLTNEEYQITGVTQSNMVNVQTGLTAEPRMWGGTITKRFGGG